MSGPRRSSSKYLESPKAMFPGTKMTFVGLKKPEERADVIAYIESVRAARRLDGRPRGAPGSRFRRDAAGRLAAIAGAGSGRRIAGAGCGRASSASAASIMRVRDRAATARGRGHTLV